MAWLKRNQDPISAKAKQLNAEIAALEAQIRRLDSRLQHEQLAPAPRVTPTPRAVPPARTPAPAAPAPRPPDLVIEGGSRSLLTDRAEPPSTPEHFNEFGVRKYDLVAALGRIRRWFRPNAPSNPQLLKLFAAGNIEGLRPLRGEKRKARRRFLILAAVLLAALLGLVSVFVRQH